MNLFWTWRWLGRTESHLWRENKNVPRLATRQGRNRDRVRFAGDTPAVRLVLHDSSDGRAAYGRKAAKRASSDCRTGIS
jgi:hypothetical protein